MIMIEVLELSNINDQNYYIDLLKKTDKLNPYSQISFFKNFSSGLDNLYCFKIEDKSSFFLLVGYIKPVKFFKSYFEFASPYGYYSPVIHNCSADYQKNFWMLLNDYFLCNNVITSFIRMSLGLEFPGFPGNIVPTMKNIKGKIVNYEQQWDLFNRKVRKNVNRAKRESLTFKIKLGSECNLNDIVNFYNIYINTMKRRNAKNIYFYSLNNFINFSKECGQFCAFSFVYHNNKIVSTEMILISKDSIFSFLGGTLSDSFSLRPNDFLKYKLINWARTLLKKYFVLGGGYKKEDNIYKYKANFFPDDSEYFLTARLIVDEIKYSEINKFYEEKFKNNKDISLIDDEEDFFPYYKRFSLS